MTDIEDQLRQLEGQYSDSDEDSCQGDIRDEEFESQEEEDLEQLIEDLYCVACDKLFKTAGARDNHETSKKHRENMEKLVKEMREEEGGEEEDNLSEEKSGDDENEGPEAIEIPQQSSKGKSKKQKKKQKKNQQVSSLEKSSDSETEKPVPNSVADDNFSSDDEDRKRNKKGKKKNKKSKLPTQPEESIGDNIEVTESHTANIETSIETPIEENVAITETKKNKKAKSKKSNNLRNENDEDGDSISRNDLTCAQCKGSFPSKNKLFDHLKKTGHAVYLPPTNGAPESSKKKKRK